MNHKQLAKIIQDEIHKEIIRKIYGDKIMDAKQEKLVHTLYDICQDRTLTTEQVFDKLISELSLIGVAHLKTQAMDVIRPYKQSGKNLEETGKNLYSILYPTSGTSQPNSIELTFD